MSKKKSISLIVIVAIICSVLSSLLTVVVVNKTGILNGTTSTSQGTSSKIVVSSDKSTNVYQAVSEKAKPSVVGITTTTVSSDNMFSMPTESTGVGTGIIVDSNGYILTNSHVISDGKAKTVSVLFNDGSTVDGQVYWYDSQLDLAIVKVNKTGLTAAELGDSDKVQIGDISIAIGNPYGLDLAGTVTQGIISGLDRTIQTEKETMTGLMQTDASINPGNSGGPLLNEKGQVIGINSAKVSSAEGIGFSIPINTAKPIIEQVIKSGNFEKVTLGIKGIDVTTFESSTGTDLAADEGVYIVEVVSDTPAQKSGIQAGDVIVKVGNDETPTMTDLNKVLYKYKSGQSTKVTVNRSGKEVTVDIKF